jgi:nicotinate-nucleotide adenylyltransferase
VRLGLFGGTFNPIHDGHLRAAEEVREAMALDLVYFIPAASPPHKPPGNLAPADHRLRMVQLATKGNRYFMVSDCEVRRSGRSYTVDTLRFFRSAMRQPVTLYLMMGADAFAELETWRECDEIARLSNLIVHSRDHAATEERPGILAALKRFGYTKSQEHYVHPDGPTLDFVTTTFLPISSSHIRELLGAQKSARYLMPSDVLDYIQRHALY